MDCGSVYIKMCEKAEEIQALVENRGERKVKWDEGSMIALEVEMGNFKVFMYDECSHSGGFIEPEIYSSRCIWLPRQDELQEMIKDSSVHNLLNKFSNFCLSTYYYSMGTITEETSATEQYYSMEQLWLSFVMNSLYQKSWNGQEWVKIQTDW